MSVTTPRPGPTTPGPTAAAAPADSVGTAAVARRRAVGKTLVGLPIANVVLIEIGLALALIPLAISSSLLVVAGGIALATLVIAFIRSNGRWLTQWAGLTFSYAMRAHAHVAEPVAPVGEDVTVGVDANTITGPEDPRVNLLRLIVPDLIVARGMDHERRPVGLAWHEGAWTAVLLVEPAPALVTALDATPSLPLGSLAPCLADRGVELDAIQVIWHCYPGSTALPVTSPALSSYLEVLGPLPAAARRTTWVAVRLDPHRCPAAVAERGGGALGAHRALIGALSRVSSALRDRGVPTRPLDPDELLRAGIVAAEMIGVAGSETRVGLRERWDGVTAAGIGHASYAITDWPHGHNINSINALTGVRALSTTVAMSLSLGDENGNVGLRGLVRVSARTPSELADANERLQTIAGGLGVTLTPLRGLQAAGFAATLPLGASA